MPEVRVTGLVIQPAGLPVIAPVEATLTVQAEPFLIAAR